MNWYGVVVENQHGGQSFSEFYDSEERAKAKADEYIAGIKEFASDRYFKVGIITAEHMPGTTFSIDADDIAGAETVYEGENDKQSKTLTAGRLIDILLKQPRDTKIMIEDSDGGASFILTEDNVTDAWERESDRLPGREHVMLLTTYKEEERHEIRN